MALPLRVALFAVVALAGSSIAAAPVPSRSAHLEGAAAIIAQVSPASPGPCTPNRAPGNVTLPQPPIIDTKAKPSFQIDVLNPADTNNGTFFCYRLDGDDSTYVEAPTIVVREHATFTMTLKDLIPPNGSPIPTPNAHAPDGCALLNTEGTPPPPTPGAGYFGRPASNGIPPDMIANDTNFHTHGWHVPPQVDNVFKSLAMSKDGTCRYVFRLSVHKTQPPGTYWYHAHLHMLSDAQVGGGLAGTLIVLPDNAPVVRPNDPKNDVVLLIKNFNGVSQAMQVAVKKTLARRPARRLTALAAPTFVPFDAFSPPPTPGTGPAVGPSPSPLPSYCPLTSSSDAQNDVLGVNGLQIPTADSDAQLATTAVVRTIPRVSQPARTIKRYRIVNAAADDYVNIGMIDGRTGAPVPAMTVVGRDGVPVNWNLQTGTYDPTKPPSVPRAQVFLPPSGRVDVEVFADKPYIIISRKDTADQRSTNFCARYHGCPAVGALRRGGLRRQAVHYHQPQSHGRRALAEFLRGLQRRHRVRVPRHRVHQSNPRSVRDASRRKAARALGNRSDGGRRVREPGADRNRPRDRVHRGQRALRDADRDAPDGVRERQAAVGVRAASVLAEPAESAHGAEPASAGHALQRGHLGAEASSRADDRGLVSHQRERGSARVPHPPAHVRLAGERVRTVPPAARVPRQHRAARRAHPDADRADPDAAADPQRDEDSDRLQHNTHRRVRAPLPHADPRGQRHDGSGSPLRPAGAGDARSLRRESIAEDVVPGDRFAVLHLGAELRAARRGERGFVQQRAR